MFFVTLETVIYSLNIKYQNLKKYSLILLQSLNIDLLLGLAINQKNKTFNKKIFRKTYKLQNFRRSRIFKNLDQFFKMKYNEKALEILLF